MHTIGETRAFLIYPKSPIACGEPMAGMQECETNDKKGIHLPNFASQLPRHVELCSNPRCL